MKNSIISLAILAFIVFLFTDCKTQFGFVQPLDNQLTEIMDAWPGTYSNDAQIAALTKAGQDIWRIDDSGEGGYLNIKSHYIKLNKPSIGSNVLYVEEYRDNNPAETYRQRIYTLEIDNASNKIRVKMWPFKDKKKYVGAWREISMLDQLKVDEISAYPDFCDLIVEQVDGKYHMYMNEQDCTFGDKVFNYEVLLGKDVFSYRDKISQKSDGVITTSAANYAYHHLDRIK